MDEVPKYEGTFAKKNRVRGLPAPPVLGPGFLSVAPGARKGKGCLARSVCNWQLALPVAPGSRQDFVNFVAGAGASRKSVGSWELFVGT